MQKTGKVTVRTPIQACTDTKVTVIYLNGSISEGLTNICEKLKLYQNIPNTFFHNASVLHFYLSAVCIMRHQSC